MCKRGVVFLGGVARSLRRRRGTDPRERGGRADRHPSGPPSAISPVDSITAAPRGARPRVAARWRGVARCGRESAGATCLQAKACFLERGPRASERRGVGVSGRGPAGNAPVPRSRAAAAAAAARNVPSGAAPQAAARVFKGGEARAPFGARWR